MKRYIQTSFIVLTLIFLVFLSSCTNLSKENSGVPSDVSTTEAISTYKINENGQTYGSASSEEDELPDLIAVIAENGKQGYVYKEDFTGEMPKSPDEAAELPKESDNIVIPVYESDGTTEIGTYKISEEHNTQSSDAEEEMPEWLEHE